MRILQNIPYTAPADDVRLMDVYLPRKPNGNLFFYAHGGGLEAGDKRDAACFAEYLAMRGTAVVSINYRMYPRAQYPDFIRDTAEALAFVKEKMPEWGAEKLYVGGSSAGGYLSMMLCFAPEYLQAFGLSNADIAGYFHDAGQPTAHFRVLRERGMDPRRVIVDESCPLFHVGTQAHYPPMRFIVSDQDMKNRYEQTMLMLSTLRHFGVEKADYVLMHGGHCAYIGRMEGEESVFGRMIEAFIQWTRLT